MLDRIINKLKFISRFPRKIAKFILYLIIIFDDFFWKFRILIFVLLCGKNNKISKALIDLKTTGIAIIPKVYKDKEVLKIKEECIKQLDDLPLEKFKFGEKIDNLILKNNVRVEKIKGSIKLKGLHKINSFFKKIGRDFTSNLLTLVYQLSLSKPFLVYSLVHDGSFNHPAVPESSTQDVISGKPHVDHYIHQLRCVLILNDIKKENGPTIFYENSMHANEIKANHLNLLLEKFKFSTDKDGGHFITDEKLKMIDKKIKKTYLTGNSGDLILLDLKSVHNASILESGQRHLLWFYY
tara:strand:+ start:519 stop:1406 length:888 start_codon:yes stop_codon:yes gene_type:complete